MNRRTMLAGIAAAAAVLALSGCGLSDEASYRFRITVEAATSAGVKSGSSVMEITAQKQEKFVSEARPLISQIRGEAVMVDTPSGPIFALYRLPDDDPRFLEAVTFALAPDLRGGGWEPFWKAVNRLGGWFAKAKAEMPRRDWPMFVRFRDVADPKTIEEVDPDEIGVKKILLETTNDGITTGIKEKMPPWFSELVAKKARFNGSSSIAITSSDLADRLGPGSFSTEVR